MIKYIAISFVSTFLYATIRYNVFGTTPFADIPTFILNKSISFTMIIMLAMILYKQFKSKKEDVDFLIKAFKIFTFIHVLLSLTLLSQNYYPRFFVDGRLTLFGNLSMLFGIIALTYIFFAKAKFNQLLFFVLIAIHLFFMGFVVWFDVNKWLGSMPPITLLCFLILIVLIIFTFFKKQFFLDNDSDSR